MLDRLRDHGNAIVVIEHNLDVVKTADWVIDLGPEGGDGGGEIVVVGTPEQVAEHAASYTGQYLRRLLGKRLDEKVVVRRPKGDATFRVAEIEYEG